MGVFTLIKMMMETVYDPYDILFGDNPKSPISDSLLFTNEVMLGNFNTDSSSISPISHNMENTETDFDPATFEKLINELLSLESEAATREIGTDPMEPVPQSMPLIINTAT